MPWGLKRYQQFGQIHFITFSCYRRRPFLSSARSKQIFELALERTRRQYGLLVMGHPEVIETFGMNRQNRGVGHPPPTPKEEKDLALFSMAIAEAHLNRSERALSLLNQLAQFAPTYPGLHLTRGMLLQVRGNLIDARDEYLSEFKITGDLQAKQQAMAIETFLRGGSIPTEPILNQAQY